MKCLVCNEDFHFRWTDTHGVGVCGTCGTPYTTLHYDDKGHQRLLPPTVSLDDEGVILAKRYWTAHKRMVFPGAYDMGILGHRQRTYSGATEDDMRAFSEWYAEQPEAALPGKGKPT